MKKIGCQIPHKCKKLHLFWGVTFLEEIHSCIFWKASQDARLDRFLQLGLTPYV